MTLKLPATSKWITAMLCILLALSLCVVVRSGTAEAATNVYTMSAFTNTSESNLYMYQSYDGTNFGLMKGPAYTPPTGLIRDPSIMKHSDGKYYIVYTTNWSGNTFGIASSPDRLNWTFVRNVTLSLPGGIGHTWAPEWFKDSDGSLNVIVSLSPGNYANFLPYKITALSSELATTSFSAPTALSGIGPNYIDTFIVKIGSTYHAFTKNETTKYIEYATATNLTGPYTFKSTDNWADWGSWVEGPALVQLDNGAWRIYFDSYTDSKYYYSDSSDGFNTWSAKQVLPGLSGTVRHMTVLKETGQPGDIRRLESYNFQNYFVRHYDFQARIDQNVSPIDDSRFRIVPGLASSSGISFESVNFPGYYLRHKNYVLVLEKPDGTSTFNSDATFKRVAGLASSSGWVSYQSYNFPSRYIRHYSNYLRIDPISTTLEKADATFREVLP
ncbi:glycoside hydrolase family 43 protein [Paenibacillus sp. sptzw28]|uniref:glycoside hydrolase family 43 protein n=1 Tax=Paenibacillus sp. sptzw28 TaxID=715179 RepID=UPI001C6F44D7|nr:glycoside hydrolase family 43 protein [Paenibacillus sp. sptzw28]QYR19243.1 glycoside hydrolase family 43 protein [Paenibacillus sp. sptzw28]